MPAPCRLISVARQDAYDIKGIRAALLQVVKELELARAVFVGLGFGAHVLLQARWRTQRLSVRVYAWLVVCGFAFRN